MTEIKEAQGVDQLISHLWLTYPIIHRLDLVSDEISISVYSNVRDIILDVGHLRQDDVNRISNPDILVSFLHDPNIVRPAGIDSEYLADRRSVEDQVISFQYQDGQLEFDRGTKCTALLAANRFGLLGDLDDRLALVNQFIDRCVERFGRQRTEYSL